MALQETQAEEIVRVTDGHGKYLEKEILDYMKYGIWNPDFRGDEAEQLWDQDQEAGSCDRDGRDLSEAD